MGQYLNKLLHHENKYRAQLQYIWSVHVNAPPTFLPILSSFPLQSTIVVDVWVGCGWLYIVGCWIICRYVVFYVEYIHNIKVERRTNSTHKVTTTTQPTTWQRRHFRMPLWVLYGYMSDYREPSIRSESMFYKFTHNTTTKRTSCASSALFMLVLINEV